MTLGFFSKAKLQETNKLRINIGTWKKTKRKGNNTLANTLESCTVTL